nr:hypothetical protein [Tanacetum cinerariifolium]
FIISSTLNHLMCMSYTDVAQVANAARNYEIFYERDDDDTERPDKRETRVISPTDLQILVLSNPGVLLRVTPIQFALLVDVDTKESVVELQADKKPGASGRVFAITEGQA